MSSTTAKSMATNTSSDGEESGLIKVETERAAEILERYDPSEEAKALLVEDAAPDKYLEQLLMAELFEDALTFLAYALPRREALWWALRCVRDVTPEEPAEEIAGAITAAETWVNEPGDENRRASMVAAEKATYGTPAGCLALGVFFSEGSMAPPDCPEVPVGEWFCARTVAAGVLLCSLSGEPEKIVETQRAFVDVGIEVANEPAPWEEKD